MSALRLLALALPALSACGGDEEVAYEQFNSRDDTVEIQVGVEEELDDLLIDLHSNTGEVIVGEADVSPGGGPSGTIHEIVVRVDDAFEEIVDRVSVRTSSGARGDDEYDLEPDFADEGFYKLELQSVADEGEVRTDTLTIRLWDVVDDTDAEAASQAR